MCLHSGPDTEVLGAGVVVLCRIASFASEAIVFKAPKRFLMNMHYIQVLLPAKVPSLCEQGAAWLIIVFVTTAFSSLLLTVCQAQEEEGAQAEEEGADRGRDCGAGGGGSS